MKGKLFQLKNIDDENVGLIHTDNEKLSDEIVQELWTEFNENSDVDDNDDDNDTIEKFIEFANHSVIIDKNGSFFVRVFVTECYPN